MHPQPARVPSSGLLQNGIPAAPWNMGRVGPGVFAAALDSAMALMLIAAANSCRYGSINLTVARGALPLEPLVTVDIYRSGAVLVPPWHHCPPALRRYPFGVVARWRCCCCC